MFLFEIEVVLYLTIYISIAHAHVTEAKSAALMYESYRTSILYRNAIASRAEPNCLISGM